MTEKTRLTPEQVTEKIVNACRLAQGFRYIDQVVLGAVCRLNSDEFSQLVDNLMTIENSEIPDTAWIGQAVDNFLKKVGLESVARPTITELWLEGKRNKKSKS